MDKRLKDCEKMYFLDNGKLRCMYCVDTLPIKLHCIKDVSIIDIPESRAKKICYCFARVICPSAYFSLYDGTLCISTDRCKNGTFYTLHSGSPNGKTSNTIYFMNDLKHDKCKIMLSIFLDITSNGIDVKCSSEIKYDVKVKHMHSSGNLVILNKYATLEQLIINADLKCAI